MIEESYIAALKRRYDFDAWAGTSRTVGDLHIFNFDFTGGDLHIFNFDFAGDELPGYVMQRVKRSSSEEKRPGQPQVQVARQQQGKILQGEPPRAMQQLKSFWESGDSPLVNMSVDVYECGSRAAAHEWLINVLGGFQLAQLSRCTEIEVGDVAFAVPTFATLLFARANVVALVRNAGLRVVKVTEIAQALDRKLLTPSDGAGSSTSQAPPGKARGQPGEITPSTDASAPLYYKVFSTIGTLERADDAVVLRVQDNRRVHDVALVEVHHGVPRLRHRMLRIGSER
jgi:hypothetical protein